MKFGSNFATPNRTACLAVIIILLTLSSLACKSHTTTLQKTQARGDEASVIAALRTIVVAQQGHGVTNEGNYGTFPQLAAGGYLDERFASDAPEVRGYVLTMSLGDKTFSCNADPTLSGDLKGRHFYVDSTSPLIRVNAKEPATSGDEVLKF
ncbi:MAG: hypothetical protein AABN95_04250 [Acidobacteriota bacterium]